MNKQITQPVCENCILKNSPCILRKLKKRIEKLPEDLFSVALFADLFTGDECNMFKEFPQVFDGNKF